MQAKEHSLALQLQHVVNAYKYLDRRRGLDPKNSFSALLASKPHLDAEIAFNPEPWSKLIQTQARLFDVKPLMQISDRLRREFHEGHAPGRVMPEIARQDWATDLLDQYACGPIGYDLPCLLSAERPARGRIMMCAQDPLRGPGAAKLTVGTFFGIDDNHLRARRHYWMIWQFIRRCVLTGYDVWVTDAIKVFAGKGVVQRNRSLRELSRSIIEAEVAAFAPDRIVTFGKLAGETMADISGNHAFISLQHPTAHGQRGSFKDRVGIYMQAVLGEACPH
ncbi:hypothetical protein [Paracoccus sp. DMF]|uniref:hypothetical protein n=1 Tax=Paracoccus sp. DMF TaxID=400837 RepID=UPI0011020764|nr:hypothetical protein [Paracoccus sp. DMF]MCV2448560.1 hypothetical protein [Paracoccus sp. DMF]